MNTTLNMVDCWSETFKLDEEVNEPSSYWDENMCMLYDEPLSQAMRLYCTWNTYCDRKLGEWIFFAPNHIFRSPTEHEFLIAQNKKKWLMFNCNDSKLHLLYPNGQDVIYDNIDQVLFLNLK